MGGRWQPALAAVVTLGLWAVAIEALGAVFAPGAWSGRAIGIASAVLGASALVRTLLPETRLAACLAGLAAGVVPLGAQVGGDGHLHQWVAAPRESLVAIRLQIDEGVAPMPVEDLLSDLVVLACLLGVWVSTLLLIGLNAFLLSGLVPVLILLVPVAVTLQRLATPLLVAVGVGLCLLLWIGAGWPRDWRAPAATGLVLVVGSGAVMLVPTTQDRVWNASAITVSPISPNVPDVTVSLGQDLLRPASAVAFRYRGAVPGSAMRFPLAVLVDLEGGTWRPSDTLDPASPSVLDLRSPITDPLPVEYTEEALSASLRPVLVQITGLVSTWLPLPQNTLMLRAAQSQSVPGDPATESWEPAQWHWVEGTQTARSTTALTRRGTEYSAWAWPLADSPELRGYFLTAPQPEDSGFPVRADEPVLEPYTRLPQDLPVIISDTAQEVTAGTDGRYAAAAALRDWFRSGDFAYDETAPYTPGADPDDPYATMEAFLGQRQGYCVHFATTFAAMARSLGIPTRVAVGYASRASSGTWTQVNSQSLHAWPEVYFEGVGWIGFEPTPGGAGVRAEASSDGDGSAAPGAQSGEEPSAPASDPGRREREDIPGATGDQGQSGGSGVPGWAPEAGIVALVALLLLAVTPTTLRRVRRLRRRQEVDRGTAPATAAWDELHDTVIDLGVPGARVGAGVPGAGAGGSDGPASSGRDLSGRSSSGRASPGHVGTDRARARTPEALVEHLVSVGALGGAEDARVLAEAVVAERFGGGDTTGGGVERGVLREALAGTLTDLFSRSGRSARLRAAVLPRSALPTPARTSGLLHPVRGRGRRRSRSRRSSRE